MVPTTGLAPVRPFGHQALDLARLLFHHAGIWYLPPDSNREDLGFEPRMSAVASGRLKLVRVEGFEPITARGLNPLPLPLGYTRKFGIQAT